MFCNQRRLMTVRREMGFRRRRQRVLCGKMNFVVLPLRFGDERDTIEMSKVSERDSVSVTRQTHMRCPPRVEADGRHHRARVMKRTKFWRAKPNWAKETSSFATAKNVRISKGPGPENVADANTQVADKRSLEFCRLPRQLH